MDVTLKRNNGSTIDTLHPTTIWSQIDDKPSTFTPTAHTHEEMVYYVEGNTTGTAGVWTGTISGLSAYYDGLTIRYRIGIAGASTTTLNINGLGAFTVYRYVGSSNITTHFAVNSVITITKVGSSWVVQNWYDSTDDYRIRWQNNITFGAYTHGYQLLAEGADGKYYPVTEGGSTGNTNTVSTAELRVGGNLLYYDTSTDMAAGSNGGAYSLYQGYYTSTMEYWNNRDSGWATAYRPVYLVGTINSNGNFVLDNSSYTSFLTQTLPTTEDGKVYVYIGIMIDDYDDFRLDIEHQTYEYKDGKLRLYTPEHKHIIADITDLTSGDAASIVTGTDTEHKIWSASNLKSAIQSLSDTDTNNYLTGVSGTAGGTITFTRNGLGSLTWDSAHSHSFASLTSKPTTILGYGITNFKSASSSAALTPEETTNALGYVNTISLFGQSDGALYNSSYNSSWVHQIFGDFRTGQIAIRGKNNGTWQPWRTVWDSSNLTGGTGATNFAWGNHTHNYVSEGGTSFSGTYPVAVRTSANTIYSDADITFTGSTSTLAVSGDIVVAGQSVVKTNDSRLSDARPASDVSAWAKASTKPTYIGSEISATVNATPASGDYILISDTSDSGKIKGSVSFGTSTTTYLRNDGTWGTPPDTNTTYTLSSFGITATASELNTLDGITATVTELNYVDGVTSNIQTQLNGKQTTITGAATTIDTENLTASRALVSDASGKVGVSVVTSTELGYLDGVTSAIQTQLNSKQDSSSAITSSNITSQYVAGVKQTRDSSNTTIWHGTQAQYDAIGTKSSSTLYFITA